MNGRFGGVGVPDALGADGSKPRALSEAIRGLSAAAAGVVDGVAEIGGGGFGCAGC